MTKLDEQLRASAAQLPPDEPFTDGERAAAGLPPFESRRSSSPSGTSHASYLRDIKAKNAADAASYDAYYAGGGTSSNRPEPSRPGEARRPSTRTAKIRKTGERVANDSRSAGRLTARSTRQILGGHLPHTVGGLFAGFLGYALLINYIRGGAPQLRGWFDAKFFNKPFTAPSGTGFVAGTPAAATAVAAGSGLVVPGSTPTTAAAA